MPLNSVLQLLVEYRYWVVVPLAFLEGPLVSVNTGFLASLGYFDPYVMFGIFVGRDIVLDGACYFLGRYGSRVPGIARYMQKFRVQEKSMEHLWNTNPARMMFVSKLAYGVSTAFLIAAGAVGVSYRRFWYYAVQVSLVQYALFLAIGYYFGQSSYALIARSVKDVELAVLGVVVLTILFLIFSRAMRRKFFRASEIPDTRN